MKIIDHAEVLRRLTPGVCIGLMRDCLADLEDGRATQYLRTVTPLPSGDIMGYMAAAVEGAFGAKLITVFPGNGSRGLPSHQGSVLLFDGPTGSLQALADGGAITEVRTGAVSAVATDLLARPDAGVLALLGTGAQARSQAAPPPEGAGGKALFLRPEDEVAAHLADGVHECFPPIHYSHAPSFKR